MPELNQKTRNDPASEARSNPAALWRWEKLNRFLTALMRALSAWAV